MKQLAFLVLFCASAARAAALDTVPYEFSFHDLLLQQAADDDRARPLERDREEAPSASENSDEQRLRRADEQKEYRDIRTLPAEFERSPLYHDEFGSHDGHTLRDHVPDLGDLQTIRSHLAERHKFEPARERLSMYNDLRTAEFAVDDNIQRNREKIQGWAGKADGKSKEFRATFDRNIGVVNDYTVSTDERESRSHSNVVLLQSDGRGSYRLVTSYPIKDSDRLDQAQHE